MSHDVGTGIEQIRSGNDFTKIGKDAEVLRTHDADDLRRRLS
jgi:hypothetical protein